MNPNYQTSRIIEIAKLEARCAKVQAVILDLEMTLIQMRHNARINPTSQIIEIATLEARCAKVILDLETTLIEMRHNQCNAWRNF